MTDKEKLIELLRDKSLDAEEDVVYVADYLLDNGVTFEGRRGHWIWHEVSGGRKRCKCSECGESHGSMATPCCPYCGVRMVEE